MGFGPQLIPVRLQPVDVDGPAAGKARSRSNQCLDLVVRFADRVREEGDAGSVTGDSPVVLADASSVFRGRFGPDLPDRLDSAAVLRLLDEKGVTDDYLRQLAPVALQRAARQACAA